MKKIAVILNPAAHSTKAKVQWHEIREICKGADFLETEFAGDGVNKALEAVKKNYDIVVAAGGDGTINEVVQGIKGSSAILGILPVGTINVFASELKIPNNLQEAWNVILAGKTKAVDLPNANGHSFVQLAGVGLDAKVVKKTTWESKKKFGPLSYLLTLFKVASRKHPKLRIETLEGIRYKTRFMLVGNGRFYGGPLQVFRKAELSDGLMDVCLFDKVDYISLIRYGNGIVWGDHTTMEDVTYFQTKGFSVTSKKKRVPLEVDGEWTGYTPCEFSFGNKSLSVLVP
ncbi:MAG: diacylglycerol kinase family protein [Verrucomicrobiota bacterium]